MPANFSETVSSYTCSAIDNAPEAVGLYAWYGVLNAGPPDWEIDIQEGVDVGGDRFRELLSRHSGRFSSPAIELIGRTTFFSTWRGTLEDESRVFIQGAIRGDGHEQSDDDSYDAKRASRLAEAIDQPLLRQALVRVVDEAIPALSAPVYVGVSDNLRRRLRTHVDGLLKLSESLKRDPTARSVLLTSDKFAARAVGMGFSPDTLKVWTVNIEAVAALTKEHSYTVAQAVEWLLNRWHRPFLGKR